jgi:hypothetical protein
MLLPFALVLAQLLVPAAVAARHRAHRRTARCAVHRRDRHRRTCRRRRTGTSAAVAPPQIPALPPVLASPPAHPPPAPQPPPQSAPSSVPPEGVYEACRPDNPAECFARLDTIRAAGFKLVINYWQWSGSADQQLAYAAHAQALGLKVIWMFAERQWYEGTNMRAWYHEISPQCGCSDDTGFQRYLVDLVKDLPATWGYYIGDEPPPTEHAWELAWYRSFKELDPNHPTLFVHKATAASGASRIAPFTDVGDVLALDDYPIGIGDPLGSVGDNAASLQALSDAVGKAQGMVLQSWSRPTGRWPTAAEEQTMRDEVLARSRPTLIIWYSFFDVFGTSDVPHGPGSHWSDLGAAVNAPT